MTVACCVSCVVRYIGICCVFIVVCCVRCVVCNALIVCCGVLRVSYRSLVVVRCLLEAR